MPVPVAFPPLPLVGRDAELAWLGAALDRAASPAPGAPAPPALLLIAGEGGVGKTRLAQAAAAEAARRGWAVAEGRAYAVETGVPYAVFADALQPILRRLDAPALADLTRGAAGELARLFPALLPAASPPAAPPEAAGAGAAEAKARLFWGVSRLLARLAERRPLLLVLDNLQWADAASTELLHFVARQAHAGPARVLVLGTYNDAERDRNPLLGPAERSLVALGAAEAAVVGPLAPADTAELVRRAFGADPAAVRDFAASLHAWTRGNPYFAEETLKALAASGRLAQRDGRWQGWDADARDLPRSVRDAVLERAGRLGAAARAALDAAAVLGGRVAPAELAAVAGLDAPALAEALDALGRARLLEDAGGGYDVAHPLVREAVYGALGTARARALHARAAEALEALRGPDALAHADALAYHLTRAGAAPPRAARYLEAAGRQALAKYADRAAADYLQAALDLRGGDAAEDLVALLARARHRLGEHDRAAALWARARDAAAARGDAPAAAEAERQGGLVAATAGRPEEALARYAAGLAMLEGAAIGGAGDGAPADGAPNASAAPSDAGAVAARLRLARAAALQTLGRRDDALGEGRRALAAAEAAGDPALLARAHRALLLLHAWTGPADAARAHGARAVALAESAGDDALAWSAHWAMAVLGGLTGDAAATARHLAASERLADATGSPARRLWTAEVAVEYMSGVGEWGAALALAGRTVAAARALGQRALLPRLLVWTALVHRGLGDLARARALADEAWALSGAGDPAALGGGRFDVHAAIPAHTGLAGVLVTAGEHRRALEVGEAGLALADRGGYVAWAVYRLLPFVIEAALYVEDYGRAAAHNARLRRDAQALGHALGLAWADTTDALLAYFTGPPGRAAPLLRAAAGGLEAVPFVFDAARLRRMAAKALRDAGDRAGAEAELRQAHLVFARLGAERELRGAREQLRELGVRPPARAPAAAAGVGGAAARAAAGAAALSAREAEIARLVAERRSNKAIGAALDISPRTVSTHLSNIYEKTGVATRGELADLVRRAGLAAGGA